MLRSFLVGAAGYPALELATRRRTHYSMALAGGLSLMLMEGMARLPGGLTVKSLLSGAGVTAIEYACGQVWNRDYRVWDYRRMPLNWKGQICLPYSLLWCGLSAVVIKAMSDRKRPS